MRYLYPILAIGVFLQLLLNCTPAMSSTQASTLFQPAALKPPQANQSGIRGNVVRLTGNHMPMIQDPALNALSRSKSQRVQTHVWVFSGRIPGRDPRWALSQAKKHPKLIGRVMSNAQGEFSVALPPGEYTVFAQYSSDLYLNSFIDDGIYATVQVKPAAITPIDLVNGENATF